MTFTFLRTCLAVVAVSLLAHTPAQAAKKKAIDYSSLRGTYQGSFQISDGNSVYPGTVTIVASSLQKGKKLKVTLSGVAQSSPIAGSFTLDQKNVTADSVLMGFFGTPIATLPGKFSGKKKNFNFAFTAAPGAVYPGGAISGTVNYSLIFGKNTLLITGSGVLITSSTFPVTISITASKVGK